MKAIDLRKKTIKNFLITIVIAILLSVGMFINSKEKDILEKQLKKLQSDVRNVDRKASDLASKQQEITKYVHIWKNLQDHKKSLDGIDMDIVNAVMNTLARKYFIVSPEIKLALPDVINSGIFKTSKIDVVHTKAILRFKALDDAHSMQYLNDFFEQISGYFAIQNINITRKANLSNQDFVSISKGKFPNIINVSTEFEWYAFKSRNLTNNKTNNKKSKRLIKL